MSARRGLFTAPTRPTKRRRLTGPKRRMRKIPRSILPEMKQFRKNTLTSGITSFAASSIGVDLSQGDSGSHFDGSKFRVHRLRLFYDLSKLTAHDGSAVRILVYISKYPTASITSAPIAGNLGTIDHNIWTVLSDRILPAGENVNAGTMDVKLNLPIEMDNLGSLVYKNDIRIGLYAQNSTNVFDAMSYQVWFTG